MCVWGGRGVGLEVAHNRCRFNFCIYHSARSANFIKMQLPLNKFSILLSLKLTVILLVIDSEFPITL